MGSQTGRGSGGWKSRIAGAGAAALCTYGSCECQDPPPPVRWSQHHADAPGRGYVDLTTRAGLDLLWRRSVGDLAFGCPVIDGDGTIFAAAEDGQLTGLLPDSSPKWSGGQPNELPDGTRIFAAPALDADGRIYVIGWTNENPGAMNPRERWTCTLHCLKPRLNRFNLIWSHRFGPGSTWSAPRVWGSGADLRIFVYFRPYAGKPLDYSGELHVLDGGGNEIHVEHLECREPHVDPDDFVNWETGVAVGPGGLIGFIIWLVYKVNNFDSGPWKSQYLEDGVFDQGEGLLSQIGSWPDATPAILSSPRATPSGKPIVVVPDCYCAMQAFEFDPVAAADGSLGPVLTRLWWEDDPKDSAYSSAAVSDDGVAVVGTNKGLVWAYDARTGQRLWECDTGEEMLGTPAFYLGTAGFQIFVTSRNHIFRLDGNGLITAKAEFPYHKRIVSSPAVSRNRVFLSATDGFHNFSLDLSQQVIDTMSPGGASSCCIGPDGRVYVVTKKGEMRAYAAPEDTLP